MCCRLSPVALCWALIGVKWGRNRLRESHQMAWSGRIMSYNQLETHYMCTPHALHNSAASCIHVHLCCVGFIMCWDIVISLTVCVRNWMQRSHYVSSMFSSVTPAVAESTNPVWPAWEPDWLASFLPPFLAPCTFLCWHTTQIVPWQYNTPWLGPH